MGFDLVCGAYYLPTQYIVYTLAGAYDKDLEDYESEFCNYKTGYEFNNKRVDAKLPWAIERRMT